MKNILWIYTGGTIACAENFTDKGESLGLRPKGNSDFLKNKLSLIPDGINVTPYTLFSLDSTNIKTSHRQLLARKVFDSYSDYDGFVITHGTDTMQYTAAALYLMLVNFNKPVIITGSQKPFDADGSDAPFNFASAFACAAAISRGVYICFGGKIISGESAVKLFTKSNSAFIDANGYFGEVCIDSDNNEYAVQLFKEPVAVNGRPALMDKLCEDVFYLKITPNLKENIIDFIKNNGYKGVICEAYGLGGIQENILNGLAMLCKNGIRVIIVSSCAYEGVDLNVYNVGIKAREAGIESGGGMTGSYVLLKLMWELGNVDNE